MANGETRIQTTLQRPYLLRAMHEWMTDNNLTPHIVIDASAAGGNLPMEHVRDGRLILNVSYSATEDLYISNERVTFDARFGGVPRHLDIPLLAVVGIYARETGQGMIFSSEQVPDSGEQPAAVHEPEASAPAQRRDSKSSPPQLKIIK
jgi:stringent starvation protein B